MQHEMMNGVRVADIPNHPGYKLTEDGRIWNPNLMVFTKPYHDKTRDTHIIKIGSDSPTEARKNYRLHTLMTELFGVERRVRKERVVTKQREVKPRALRFDEIVEWFPSPSVEGVMCCRHGGWLATWVPGSKKHLLREDGNIIYVYQNNSGTKVTKPTFDQKERSAYVKFNTAEGKPCTGPLRRLMARLFVANPDNHPHVLHVNGDRFDCAATNLRWGVYRPGDQVMKKYDPERYITATVEELGVMFKKNGIKLAFDVTEENRWRIIDVCRYYPRRIRAQGRVTIDDFRALWDELSETITILKEYRQYNDKRGYYRLTTPRIKITGQARRRAEETGTPYDLHPEDIRLPRLCPYLGIPLEYYAQNKAVDASASIDKIVPSLGYVKGNVQIISKLANAMKSSATIDQMLTFARNAIKLHG